MATAGRIVLHGDSHRVGVLSSGKASVYNSGGECPECCVTCPFSECQADDSFFPILDPMPAGDFVSENSTFNSENCMWEYRAIYTEGEYSVIAIYDKTEGGDVKFSVQATYAVACDMGGVESWAAVLVGTCVAGELIFSGTLECTYACIDPDTFEPLPCDPDTIQISS